MTNLSLENFENGVKLYQNNNLYKFTSDSIKLAKFCNIKKTDNVLDLCAGCGVVGLYAYSIKPFNKLYFNEIQPQMCELIELNIQVNDLGGKTKVLCKDLNNLTLSDIDKPLDVIICNPPYFKFNGKINKNASMAMCRHEISTNLNQIVFKAGKLLKSGGRFYIIIPANRMCECVKLLVASGLEVKRLEVCHTNGNATVCLIEGVKGACDGVDLKVVKEGYDRDYS